jgi:hypothetical protein
MENLERSNSAPRDTYHAEAYSRSLLFYHKSNIRGAEARRLQMADGYRGKGPEEWAGAVDDLAVASSSGFSSSRRRSVKPT